MEEDHLKGLKGHRDQREQRKGEQAPEQSLAEGSKVHNKLGHNTFLSHSFELSPATNQSPPEQTT